MTKQSEYINRLEQTVRDNTNNISGQFIVGVSGGADSTALLTALVRTRHEVTAVHCNFQLRGDESDRDEEFTKNLCCKLGVECITVRFDTAKRCSGTNESIEMACRSLRYDFFRDIMTKRGCKRIAIAHTNDDNIETMLLNLFRGTGVDGIRGMIPDTGEIIRPLLSLSRLDIENYLSALNQDFITDSSNLSTEYRRNLIRRTIIPSIQEEWPGIISALSRTRQNMADVSAIYHDSINRALNGHDHCLPLSTIMDFPAPRALVFEFIKQYGGSDIIANEITKSIISRSRGNGKHTAGKRWKLKDVSVVIGYMSLEIIDNNQQTESKPEYECTERPYSEALIKEMRNSAHNNCVWLPRPAEHYTFRHPKPDDIIRSIGLNGSQKISKVLKDAKLTHAEKQAVWMLVDAKTDEPIWIPGMKRSRTDLISPGDTTIYRISLKKTT